MLTCENIVVVKNAVKCSCILRCLRRLFVHELQAKSQASNAYYLEVRLYITVAYSVICRLIYPFF